MDRARAVWVESGGDVDPYTDVTMFRFCSHNNWNERRTNAHIRKAVAWRTSKSAAARYRASFVAGARLCEKEDFVLGMQILPNLPYLGRSISGLQIAEYLCPGTLVFELLHMITVEQAAREGP
jgi:hypothetical protein